MRVDAREYGRARRSGRATSVRVAPTGTAVEGYQVPLGNRHSLKEAGVIGLPSWSERSAQTETWVKVPRLSATCPRRVVAFDGGKGSIDKTMEFGDEFGGSALDTAKWTVTAGTVTVSGSVATSTGATNQRVQPKRAYGVGWATKGRMRLTGDYALIAAMPQLTIWKTPSAYAPKRYTLDVYTDAWTMHRTLDTGVSAVDWYRIETIRAPGAVTVSFDGAVVVVVTTNLPTGTAIPEFGVGLTTSETAECDWFLVRKYVPNEPLAGTAKPSTTNRALSRPMSHADLMRAVCA